MSRLTDLELSDAAELLPGGAGRRRCSRPLDRGVRHLRDLHGRGSSGSLRCAFFFRGSVAQATLRSDDARRYMNFEQAGELGWIRRRQKVAASRDRRETASRNNLSQDLSDAHQRRVAIAATHDERRYGDLLVCMQRWFEGRSR